MFSFYVSFTINGRKLSFFSKVINHFLIWWGGFTSWCGQGFWISAQKHLLFCNPSITLCIFPSSFFTLCSPQSCVSTCFYTHSRGVVKSEKGKKKIYIYIPSDSSPLLQATEMRPRVPVSSQNHASTAHLFMEEEESKGQVWRRKSQEERSLWLSTIL